MKIADSVLVLQLVQLVVVLSGLHCTYFAECRKLNTIMINRDDLKTLKAVIKSMVLSLFPTLETQCK